MGILFILFMCTLAQKYEKRIILPPIYTYMYMIVGALDSDQLASDQNPQFNS